MPVEKLVERMKIIIQRARLEWKITDMANNHNSLCNIT